MSLIPSESYSFPDHFTKTVIPSREPKQEKPQPEKIHQKPAIVALPDPEPEFEPEFEPIIDSENEFVEDEPVELPLPVAPPPPVKQPVPVPRPNPALRRAHAPPPRIPDAPVRKLALPASLKPKVRWNNRAAPIDPATNRNNGNGNGANERLPALPPAENVIPMKAPRPVPRPPQPVQPPRPAPPAAVLQRPVQQSRPVPPPPVLQRPAQPPPPRKPVAVATQMRPARPQPLPAPPKPAPRSVSIPEADFFEVFAENGFEAANKRRRQMKFRRFVACEGAALLVLLPLVILGLTLNINAPALRWIMNILTIAAAVAAAVIPIGFYAFTPTLPELER
jgi:hypothetical protein